MWWLKLDEPSISLHCFKDQNGHNQIEFGSLVEIQGALTLHYIFFYEKPCKVKFMQSETQISLVQIFTLLYIFSMYSLCFTNKEVIFLKVV